MRRRKSWRRPEDRPTLRGRDALGTAGGTPALHFTVEQRASRPCLHHPKVEVLAGYRVADAIHRREQSWQSW